MHKRMGQLDVFLNALLRWGEGWAGASAPSFAPLRTSYHSQETIPSAQIMYSSLPAPPSNFFLIETLTWKQTRECLVTSIRIRIRIGYVWMLQFAHCHTHMHRWFGIWVKLDPDWRPRVNTAYDTYWSICVQQYILNNAYSMKTSFPHALD
jgi:hypothetical protein